MEATASLLTPSQLADQVQVPLQTVYRWRHIGYGPPGVRMGRHVRYRQSDVDAWIQQQLDQRAAG